MRFVKRLVAVLGLVSWLVGVLSAIGVSAAETVASVSPAPAAPETDLVVWFAVGFALCAGGILPLLLRGKSISLK